MYCDLLAHVIDKLAEERRATTKVSVIEETTNKEEPGTRNTQRSPSVLLTCRLCTGGEFIAPFDFRFFSEIFGRFAIPLLVQVGQDQ